MATLTDTIGRVLSGRYRIDAALGTGASAHVYVATDVTLKRQVAIKMLHPVLAADRAFLKRFRSEAQAAASLAHPNLVAVYDWGEDTDGPYLVLEMLGGGSMRELLDDEHPLQPAHVASIGAQAAHGLAYAHARGFVHRDVKPANLLFDEDRRRLCVADFGLARALAEAAWTEPVGATLGTARYAAPEQAQGKRVDGRADVYALSLVLYEALTGSVPFGSDTTIGTLMARVGATLPAHSALGPLEAVLRAAAAPEPEERLSASELARSLSQLARELPSPGSLPDGRIRRTWRPYDDVSHIDGSPVNGNGSRKEPETADDDIDAMALAEAIGIADEPAKPYVRTPVVADSLGPVAPKTDGRIDDLTEIGAPAQSDVDPPAKKKKQKAAEPTTPKQVVLKSTTRHRRWPWVVALVIILLAGVAAGGLIAIKKYKVFAPTPSHKVPSFAGLTPALATSAVVKDHFHVRVSGHAYNLTVPVGGIISQSPRPGIRLVQGKTISVVTSLGPPPVPVPALASITAGGCPAVTAVLSSGHLKPLCAYDTSISVKDGGVISFTQDVKTAIWGTTIRVVISTGLPQVAVPDIAGMSKDELTNSLNVAHFTVAFGTAQYSSTVPTGEPLPGWTGEGKTLLYGSTVGVVLSLGHAPVAVPNVAGDSQTEAVDMLESEGFTISAVYGPNDDPVTSTDPLEGTVEPYGYAVDVYLGPPA